MTTEGFPARAELRHPLSPCAAERAQRASTRRGIGEPIFVTASNHKRWGHWREDITRALADLTAPDTLSEMAA